MARVRSITLAEILIEHGVHEIVLLRQDCEGCELDVIPAWEQEGLLSRIYAWTGEYHPEVQAQYGGKQREVHTRSLICRAQRLGQARAWNVATTGSHGTVWLKCP